MVEIRIGRGTSVLDNLHVNGINPKNYDCKHCPISQNKKYDCVIHNGSMTVFVNGGMDRNTVDEFRNLSLCCKD